MIEKLANLAMVLMGTLFLCELVIKARANWRLRCERLRREAQAARLRRQQDAQSKLAEAVRHELRRRPPLVVNYTVTWNEELVQQITFIARSRRSNCVPADTRDN